MTASLDQFSVLLLISALGVYAVAFIAFALDLARRSADAEVRTAAVTTGAPAAVGSGGTTVLAPPVTTTPAAKRRLPVGRIAVVLTVAAWALQLGAVLFRGLAAGRVPWANMYEFSMTGTFIIMTIYLVALLRVKLAFLGTLMTALVLVLLGIATVQYRVGVSPLSPPLQSYWLVIHVFVAILGTGFFTLGATVSMAQLLQARNARVSARRPDARPSRLQRVLSTLPAAETLENTAYRTIIVGFILWTFTLIAGAIWAEHAWGRYWGWDTKEVWTFIIWVIYAGYIHARATRGWRGDRSGWLALIGFAAVLFNFGVVNVFFHGLHAYAGLPS